MQVTLCLPQGHTVREEGEVHKQCTAIKVVVIQGDTEIRRCVLYHSVSL